MNESLRSLGTFDNLIGKISFILEKLGYQDQLNVGDIPANIQTFLISRLSPAPHGVIGYIWTKEFRSQIIGLLDICILIKESLLKVSNIIEGSN